MAQTTGTLLRRAMRRRCPVCANKPIFRSWVRMTPQCSRCGLWFNRIPGHWLGSWFLNIIVVQTALVIELLIGVTITWPDPPMWNIGILAVVVAIAVPFWFFPYSRTLWAAIDLAMRPLDFDEGVAPGFELEEDFLRFKRERDNDDQK